MFQVISPSKGNPERQVVRWQFKTREQAEDFVQSIRIVEVQTVSKDEVGDVSDFMLGTDGS